MRSAGLLRVVQDTSPITLEECLAESRMVMFTCVAELLAKTGVQPHQASCAR